LVDIVKKENNELAKTLKKKYNTMPFALHLDITKENEVQHLIKLVLQKFKKIDILINNAHYVERNNPNTFARFEDYPLFLWEKMTSDNLRGIFLCSNRR